MANDNNNKINVLVSQPDDDPTATLAVAGHLGRAARYDSAELEADAKTFDVDQFANGHIPDDESAAALKSALKNRVETINQLQFEIEQLRAKWNGLDRELKAREVIAAKFSEEFRLTRSQLKEAERDLQEKTSTIELLQRTLSETNEREKQLLNEADQQRDDADKEIEFFRHQIAEQSGLLASNAHETRDVHEQIARTEKYADSIRLQLQDQTSTTKDAVSMQRRLEAALAETRGQIRDLGEQLERELRVSQELAKTIIDLKEQFAEETRKIRFELGSAQETISSQETMNEQLASDLTDNREFRQALESQLGEKEIESEKNVRQLMLRLGQARQEADDYERKMRSKDKAIAALMSELANLNKADSSSNSTENTLFKIEGSRSDNVDDSAGNGRARVARMLVCHAGGDDGGRELRFPLFKDRLTIGRTGNNDIQLNVRYISRRHAVIATDKGQTRLIDWGSKNGVFVNDKRVSEKFLSSGDVVKIGEKEFRYEERPKG
jgi:chromosome segregation ATPase